MIFTHSSLIQPHSTHNVFSSRQFILELDNSYRNWPVPTYFHQFQSLLVGTSQFQLIWFGTGHFMRELASSSQFSSVSIPMTLKTHPMYEKQPSNIQSKTRTSQHWHKYSKLNIVTLHWLYHSTILTTIQLTINHSINQRIRTIIVSSSDCSLFSMNTEHFSCY